MRNAQAARIACGEAFRAKEHGWSSSFLALIFGALFLGTWPQTYAFILNFLCLGLFISSVVHCRELLASQVSPNIQP